MAREPALMIAPGDLVVRRGGSLTTLIRVTKVGAARKVSMRMPRMEQVLSGIYMHRGGPHAVDDLPVGLYRPATGDEVAAAQKQGTVPPAGRTDLDPFGY